jgi:hypothetical protein
MVPKKGKNVRVFIENFGEHGIFLNFNSLLSSVADPDPDPVVKGADPDSSIIKQKQ